MISKDMLWGMVGKRYIFHDDTEDIPVIITDHRADTLAGESAIFIQGYSMTLLAPYGTHAIGTRLPIHSGDQFLT